MAVNLGSIFASVVLRLDQLDQGVRKAEAKFAKLEKASKRMKDVGKKLSTAVTLPILAIGGAAFAAANNLDQAMDTIRAGTGATGEALAALGEDFKVVLKAVPQGMGPVSTAIADLNTRTGLTGEALQDMAIRMLNLARVSQTEVAPLVAATTRVFGDWGVANKDTAKTMDYLWKVSQTTGIGVDQLAQKVVQFGAPLRAMGFDLETSAAMLGKWEKEGVNAELVLGSLRIGLVHFAKEGLAAPEALQKTITEIKNMGDAAAANAAAVEVFGARAGPDMAAAIREGRFDLDELLKTLQASPETINAAAQETASFGEKIRVLGNTAVLAIEPLGRILLDIAERTLPRVTDAVERLSASWQNMSTGTQGVVVTVAALVAALGPLLYVLSVAIKLVSGLVAVYTALKTALIFVFTKAGLLTTVTKQLKTAKIMLTAAITALKAAYAGLKIAMIFVFTKAGLLTYAKTKLAAATLVLAGATGTLTAAFAGMKAVLIVLKTVVLVGLKAAIIGLKAAFLLIISPVGLIAAAIAGLVAIGVLLWRNWDTVRAKAIEIWTAIKTFFSATWAAIHNTTRTIVTGIRDWLVGTFSGIVKSIRSVFSGVTEAITAPLRQAQAVAAGIVAGIVGLLARINPFARSSPSLVEDVARGVRMIMDEYQKLKGLRLIAPVAALAAGGAGQGRTLTPVQPQGYGNAVINLHISGPVYGVLDFEDRVKSAIRDGIKAGAFRGVIPEVK